MLSSIWDEVNLISNIETDLLVDLCVCVFVCLRVCICGYVHFLPVVLFVYPSSLH